MTVSPDLLVVGAGAMGAWTPFWARRAGLRTAPAGPDEERFSLARPRVEQAGMRMATDSGGEDWQGY